MGDKSEGFLGPHGPKEAYEMQSTTTEDEIVAAEIALRWMLFNDPSISLIGPKTLRAVHRETGASRESIGIAAYIVSQGGEFFPGDIERR